MFSEAQTDQLVRERVGAEDGERDRRHPNLCRQPAAEAHVVKIGEGAVVRQQEVGALTWQEFQPAGAQRLNKQIAAFTSCAGVFTEKVRY